MYRSFYVCLTSKVCNQLKAKFSTVSIITKYIEDTDKIDDTHLCIIYKLYEIEMIYCENNFTINSIFNWTPLSLYFFLSRGILKLFSNLLIMFVDS